MPFRGEYDDDQGTLDFREDPPEHWPFTKSLLSIEHFEWTADRYDKNFKPLPLVYDYEKFFNIIERGWVRGHGIKGTRGQPGRDSAYPVGQMLVRQDVWDYLLGVRSEDDYDRLGRELNLAFAREYVAYLLGKPPIDKFGFLRTYEIERHFLDGEYRYSNLVSGLFRSREAGFCFGMYNMDLSEKLLKKEITSELAIRLLDEMGDFTQVNQAMYSLRRAWRPQPGKGSQDIGWPTHEAFAKEVARIANVEENRND